MAMHTMYKRLSRDAGPLCLQQHMHSKSGQKGNWRHACGRACSRPLAMSDWKPGIASEMPTARLMAKKGTPPPIMASTSVLFTTCRRAWACSP